MCLGRREGFGGPGLSVPLPVRMLSPALCKTWLRESWSLKKPLTKSTLYDLELGANSHLQVDFFLPFWTLWHLTKLPTLLVPEARGCPVLCWLGSRKLILTKLQGPGPAGSWACWHLICGMACAGGQLDGIWACALVWHSPGPVVFVN